MKLLLIFAFLMFAIVEIYTDEPCGQNEIWGGCYDACCNPEPSCEIRIPIACGIVCPIPCRPNCVCKPGYFRKRWNGPCVSSC
ncbi:venom serine protease inhibitor-like [Diabrotica virgifera virgifera]|uniref:Venom serine protease inhibitor-like n=1 Tax=Diabrotica virgifera virgifera TaxID=50390 RepID=A0A6P7FKM7_DIAVI|nr:venom serine protease inhibitor-like [Diabrotica virgifera virgifera]